MYIVERYTLRGILFHRNCLRCDYCGAVLRVSSYDCQTLPDGTSKYLCFESIDTLSPMGRRDNMYATVTLAYLNRFFINFSFVRLLFELFFAAKFSTGKVTFKNMCIKLDDCCHNFSML